MDPFALSSDYALTLWRDVHAVIRAVGRMSDLLQEPDPLNTIWRSEVELCAASIGHIRLKLAALQPPTGAAATQAAIVGVVDASIKALVSVFTTSLTDTTDDAAPAMEALHAALAVLATHEATVQAWRAQIGTDQQATDEGA